MLFKCSSASLRRSRRATFPRSRRDSLLERRRAVRSIHRRPDRRDRPAEYILSSASNPRGAPEGDGDPNNSATSAESFSARIRRRRRAAVEGSIAGDERTWIDLDEIVELEISGVD